MTGRQETTMKIETRIKKLLNEADPLISDFYYSLGRKTASTKEIYVRHIIHFSEFFHEKSLLNIKKADIGRYLDETKYTKRSGKLKENSASFMNAKLAAIKCFYKNLVDQGVIQNNPAASIDPINLPGLKDPVYMTEAEYKTVIKNIRTDFQYDKRGSSRSGSLVERNVSIFMLGCITGLRVTSITEINVSDVDFDEKSIIVTEKGNKTRKVYFDDGTADELKSWLNIRSEMKNIKTDALFVSQNGNRLTSHDISSMLSKYTDGLGKHITPHKMRSTCATTLYKKTGNIYRVQKTLGHKNIANTMRYTGFDAAEQKESANILGKAFK